ncbi:MAG TPA: hypothetical protein ENK66_06840 [Arcobacter sp.]|jgi:protein-disulfide isomerase|nr:hypothetical protein [Arcobacter sp.]
MANKKVIIIVLSILLGTFLAYTYFANKNNPLINKYNNVQYNAKVQIVDFFDPACGACAQSHFFVKDLKETNPDISVSLRYAPLHPDSIRVVTILEATKKQDMFLESLEATLHFQNKWVGKPKHNIDALLEILSNLGLDMEKLKNDIKSSDVIKVVEEDIKDKNTLKIKKTPTYYINTKLLERYSLTNLRDTVLMELNK